MRWLVATQLTFPRSRARLRRPVFHASRLGVTGGERFAMPGLVDEALAELSDAFYGGLEQALSS